MPKIAYMIKNLRVSSLQIIDQANEIIDDYRAQGFDLTLRQLYYQFVARALLPNTQRSYKRLGSIINDGRLCGLIDWDAIEDRTRNLRSLSHWASPRDIIAGAAGQYRIDKWEDQSYRVEIWIEKDALIGVIEGICARLDVPYFSCRGYVSQSEMWGASQRLLAYEENEQDTVVIHLGDHDPSGVDMSRDIQDRLRMFGCDTQVRRIALNWDQVEQYSPPPNPTKLSDSRAEGYIAEHGDDSWELDALEPQVLSDLIEGTVLSFRDKEPWCAAVAKEKAHRKQLRRVSRKWAEIVETYCGSVGAD